MSLILTGFSPLGIVQVADSHVIRRRGGPPLRARRVYRIGRRPASIAVAGRFSVGRRSMDRWLPRFLSSAAVKKAASLADVAEALRGALQSGTIKEEREHGILCHVAGYERSGAASAPVLWFVGNTDVGEDGNYPTGTATFRCEERFWERYCERSTEKRAELLREQPCYIDGLVAGRVGFNVLKGTIEYVFRSEIWGRPSLGYRPPVTLAEVARMGRLCLETVGVLSAMRIVDAGSAGGPLKTVAIRIPR